MNYRALVTDIEGTTTRISFVTEVLFPYAAEQLPEFIRQRSEQAEVAMQLKAVRQLMKQPEASLDAIIAQLQAWIAADEKITPLKALQGMIWRLGYQQGHFTGHLYPDAAEQLKAWQAKGVQLFVYSSGSVEAQQLLFRHSDFGDLTPLFSGYFDTRIGGKKEISSYAAILQHLQFPPSQVLFVSDVVAELDAASKLGIATTQLIRDGQAPGTHPVARDFYQIEV
ncbi:acireductone synthase [Alkalimonas delamerensis]|uniref:Enolase-phosphatase E1 n=1 Tax=Alkalimonas delamerensis TaxID=265981 RepID=A0ABT9GTI5_9GAMM|nr:acireductone synthase [Alkalimonas delamerensis]MDP4530282.1 acireductone synthase [Alkalimonas delamerensis]